VDLVKSAHILLRVCVCVCVCVYRDASVGARLVVGAFTVTPSNGVVPASGQAVVTVECVAEQAGYISEVSTVVTLPQHRWRHYELRKFAPQYLIDSFILFVQAAIK